MAHLHANVRLGAPRSRHQVALSWSAGVVVGIRFESPALVLAKADRCSGRKTDHEPILSGFGCHPTEGLPLI